MTLHLNKKDYGTNALDMMKKHYEFYGQLNYMSGIDEEDYITRGAYIECSLGTTIELDAYEDHGVLDQNTIPLMTCEDCKVGENIWNILTRIFWKQNGNWKSRSIQCWKLPK